jgi:hypothetical protein
MGLSNSAKKANSYSQTINQNQGGGNKKAGFPYMIGRSWQTSIAFNNTNVANGHCCKLSSYQKLLFTYPVTQSRGVGVDVRLPMH